ncbi:MAG: hypothetical protein GY765_08085 [bacterium]|nr:hypothetical protein [bacterium]
MDEQFEKELNQLKEEFYKRKEAVSGIRGLVTETMDRDFPTNFWELSPKELDGEMGTRLSFMNADIDPRPDKQAITSHRKILGKLIVPFKKIIMKFLDKYTNTLLEKQWRMNDQQVAFHLATFVRLRHNEDMVNALQEKMKFLEEEMELFSERLDGLENEKK